MEAGREDYSEVCDAQNGWFSGDTVFNQCPDIL